MCGRNGTFPGDDGENTGTFPGGDEHERSEMEEQCGDLQYVYRVRRVGGRIARGTE